MTLPLIENKDCDLHIELYETTEPNPFTSTLPITLVNIATSNPDPLKPLQFQVDSAAFLQLDLTNPAYDNTQLTMVGKAVSDDPLAEVPPLTFLFTLDVYDRPCTKNFATVLASNSINYNAYEPTLATQLTGFTNNDCEFTIALVNQGDLVTNPTSFAPVTVIQPTF